jgi:hypothetical protein
MMLALARNYRHLAFRRKLDLDTRLKAEHYHTLLKGTLLRPLESFTEI